jgi:hypothetical protein
MESERRALESLRDALDEERLALASQRESLEVLASRRRPSPQRDLPTLESLLQARGLRGADEFERAIAGLASGRALADLIWGLRVDGAEVWAKALRARLVLVAGNGPKLPAGVGVPVAVAPDRAELPSLDKLQADLDRVGELFMLHGMRRVLFIGGRPAWQRLVREGVDPRVELRFQPGRARTRADAEADLVRTDAVILWGVSVAPEAKAIYETARPLVVLVSDGSLGSLLRALSDTLDS